MNTLPTRSHPSLPDAFAPTSWTADGAVFGLGAFTSFATYGLWRSSLFMSAADWQSLGPRIGLSLATYALVTTLAGALGGLSAALVLRLVRPRVSPVLGLTLAGLAAASPLMLEFASLERTLILFPLVALTVTPLLPWLAVQRARGTSRIRIAIAGAGWAGLLMSLPQLPRLFL